MTTEAAAASTTSVPLLSRETGLALCAILLVEMVFIVVGNSFAFGAFRKQRRLKRRSFYLLINLAVADFFVGAVSIPFRVYYLATDLWSLRSHPPAQLAYEISQLFTIASIMSLVTISFERMLAVVWPIKHRTLSTRFYYALVGVTWAYAGLCPAFDIMNYHAVIPEEGGVLNWLVLLTLAPLFIFLNYVSIWIKCRFAESSGGPGNDSSFRARTNRTASARARKLAKSLFLLTMVSLVTVLPAPIMYVYFYFSHEAKFAACTGTCRMLYMSAHVLFYSNSSINPIIYTLSMPEVREYAVQLICRRSPRERSESMRMRSWRRESSTMRTDEGV